MRPDWELNQGPLGAWDDAQLTEPTARVAPFILKRKILDMSDMLTYSQNIFGRILKTLGEELGVWETQRKGDFNKMYILLYLLNVSHIQLL